MKPPALDKHETFPRIAHQRRYNRTVSWYAAILKVAHLSGQQAVPERYVSSSMGAAELNDLLAISQNLYRQNATSWG